jgi:hypothetical protein
MAKQPAPKTALSATEYFRYDTAGPDPVAAWVKYVNFCRKRNSKPVSTPEEFHQAWQTQREKYAARRAKLGIVLPPKKAVRR